MHKASNQIYEILKYPPAISWPGLSLSKHSRPFWQTSSGVTCVPGMWPCLFKRRLASTALMIAIPSLSSGRALYKVFPTSEPLKTSPQDRCLLERWETYQSIVLMLDHAATVIYKDFLNSAIKRLAGHSLLGHGSDILRRREPNNSSSMGPETVEVP